MIVGSLDGAAVGEAILPNPVSLIGLFISAANPLLTVDEGAVVLAEIVTVFDTATASGFEATLVGSCFAASTVSFAEVDPKLNPPVRDDCATVVVAAGGKLGGGCVASSSSS